MNVLKTVVAAAAVTTLTASAVSAGGFAAVIDVTPTQIIVPTAPAAGSLPGWVIPAAVAAALIAVATQGGSD